MWIALSVVLILVVAGGWYFLSKNTTNSNNSNQVVFNENANSTAINVNLNTHVSTNTTVNNSSNTNTASNTNVSSDVHYNSLNTAFHDRRPSLQFTYRNGLDLVEELGGVFLANGKVSDNNQLINIDWQTVKAPIGDVATWCRKNVTDRSKNYIIENEQDLMIDGIPSSSLNYRFPDNTTPKDHGSRIVCGHNDKVLFMVDGKPLDSSFIKQDYEKILNSIHFTP